MAKRRSDTACATPGLNDARAENVILSCLLHEPRVTVEALSSIGFKRVHFYFDPSHRLYELIAYVMHGGATGPVLADVFGEMWHRKQWLDFPNHNDAAIYLYNLWSLDVWPHDMSLVEWGTALPYHAWAGLAAAARVRHLASRRAAIYAARELIRDALDPAGDADYLDGRVDQLGDV